MKSILLRLLLLSGAMTLTVARAAPSSTDDAERKAVLAVVQKFFDAMAAHDGTTLTALLLPEGSAFSTREESGKFALRSRALGDFATRLTTMTDKLLERMWDPTVLVHDRIATVWTPYDFHLNDKYSHGGIDIFNLVKTEDGWKIAAILYTVEPNTTVHHPGGPPPGVK